MKHLSKLALLAAAFFTGLSANAQSINAFGGQSVTISSDQTCTSFDVLDGTTLTVNQGVTLTLNISNGFAFNFFDNSKMELHGTLAGSVASGATWMDNTYINVYLSDGAKYTVTGLTCIDGDNYLRYYGYDAATDGNGTVSVMNGTTAVTASSIGYKTTTYTFTATPSSGYRFVNWTKGAGGEVLGTDASINVTCEQNGTYQVYANFEADVPAGPQMRTLTGVPQGWQVQAGAPLADVDSNADGSYSIEAGQPVRLVPSAEDKPRVKSVTLVDNSTPAAVLVESITLNKTATTITAGQTETLSVSSVTPDDATDQTVTWSSDNEAVATVDADGKVTAVALGTANITATANDGSGVTATCAVTVSPRIVTWNPSDIVPENPWDHSFTKDGITITAATCDFQALTFAGGGTFTTTLGNFTKIEISADYTGDVSGTGWSNDGWQSATWTGNAASVSFSGDIWGGGMTCEGGNLTIVFTFEQ